MIAICEPGGTTPNPWMAATGNGRDGAAMLLADLCNDALSHVAERVVRAGEACWFASTCHAARQATRHACARLKLPLCTKAATACLTLRRLELAMTLPRFLELVHANMNATSASSRPHSLGRKWVWSPAGERVLAAGATPEVLDYAWAGWRLSLEPLNPGCFLVRAAAAGRVDLLKEMDRTAEEQALDPILSGRTLRHKLGLIGGFPTGAYPVGLGSTLEWVETALMEPALRGGKPDAIEWYYDRMEMGDLMVLGASPHSLWRTALDSRECATAQGPLARLARAAALGKDPYAMLGFLQTWMWPRLGSRAPMQCRRAHIAIAGATIRSLVDATNDEAAQAWQWLQGAWPQGVRMMLEVLSSEGNVHVAPIARHIFEVRNVRVYQWMQARLEAGKWMGGLCEVNNSDRSRRLRFAHATLGAIAKRRTEQEKCNPHAAWELDRALCVQALTDACECSVRPDPGGLAHCIALWDEQWQQTTGVHADALLEHDPGALVDALCAVATLDAPCAHMLGYIRQTYVAKLREAGSGCTHAMACKLRDAGVW